MSQMRPALLAKNPGISSKEAIAWTSKHWQQLDMEVFIFYIHFELLTTDLIVSLLDIVL